MVRALAPLAGECRVSVGTSVGRLHPVFAMPKGKTGVSVGSVGFTKNLRLRARACDRVCAHIWGIFRI
jgi:hypothetical protein